MQLTDEHTRLFLSLLLEKHDEKCADVDVLNDQVDDLLVKVHGLQQDVIKAGEACAEATGMIDALKEERDALLRDCAGKQVSINNLQALNADLARELAEAKARHQQGRTVDYDPFDCPYERSEDRE